MFFHLLPIGKVRISNFEHLNTQTLHSHYNQMKIETNFSFNCNENWVRNLIETEKMNNTKKYIRNSKLNLFVN